ncbi:MAG: BTAD domain-containing putative transcriptional regulator [Dethiobacteria bacterium]|jgi:two-component SAPR family response regulator|nr:BTAD domain-containing putative transcriptional regulator [Bacillota bacterium]
MSKYKNNHAEKESGTVKIFTLGRFLLRRGEKVLSEGSVRAVKVWLLFKYLLTHREKALTTEEILTALWPGQEYKDPNQAVRSLIYRLRRLFTDELDAPELAENVVFAHGCYRWAANVDYWLDVAEFERCTADAELLCETDPAAAIRTLQKAVALYVGTYLPECSYQEWVVPTRSYYHHLYVKNVVRLAGLLRADGSFAEITLLCRNALAIEYFEEQLHRYYLEALIEEGKNRQARRHYEEVTAVFYREMGVKPSAAMRQLYGRIQFKEDDSINLNLSLIQERLKARDSVEGAFLCDHDLFHYFYQLEKKRQERSGQSVCLCLLALTNPDYHRPPREKLQESMETLSRVLRDNLRKGDVICRSHEAQFLLLLPGLDALAAKKVLLRIEEQFWKIVGNQEFVLHKKCQNLSPGRPG